MKKNTAKFNAVIQGLTVMTLTLLSILLTGITGLAQTATDGDYRSRVTTGNWSTGSSWEVRSGGTWSTASAAPTSSNNVYIQPGHSITVDVAIASCRDFHIATATAGTSVPVGTNFLDVYGKMRWFTNASGAITGSLDGAFYSGNTSSSSGGNNSMSTTSPGALRIRGTKRTVFASTDWGASGFANTIAIFNMSSSTDTAFITSAVKLSSVTITNNSTVSAGSSTRFALASDNGNFTIETGSTLIAARGGSGNILFSGASNATTKMGTLTIAGTLEFTGSAPIFDCSTITTTGGTIIYSLAGTQTLMVKGAATGSAALNTYNNLILKSTSAKTLSSNTTVNGKLTLQGTASLGLGGFTLSYGAGATLEYARSNSVTVDAEWPAANGPANVTINQAGNVGFSTTVNTLRTITGTFTLSGGGNFTVDDNAPTTPTVANVLTFANGSTIVRTAGQFNNSGGTYSIGTSATDVVNLTINGNGLTSSGEFVSGTLNPGRYGTFTITSGNTYTLTSSSKSVNALVLDGALADGGATLTVRGNITGTGTHTGTGKITMSGNTASSNISGASFTNLELNDADGFTLTGSPSVSGTLTLALGLLTTSSNTMILNSPFTSSISRTSGWVNGNLKKVISSNNSPVAIFEVGDASSYAPVTFQFDYASTGSTGSIIVSTTAGDHPQLSTSGLITTKSVSRYWTLTNDNPIAGLTSFSPTFIFGSGDIDAGANTADFVIKRYASSAWSSTTVGTASALGTSALGVTGFGDFAIGEPVLPVITTSGTLLTFTTVAGTASVAQSFSVSGADMNAGITVTPPSGFEVSTTSDFSSNVGTNAAPIIVGAAGTISATTIYVRIAATAAEGSYNGLNVSLSSTGAVTKTVAIPNSSVTTSAVPTLVSSTASLSAFNGTAAGSVSNELTFIVSGTNLTNDITITAPTNFRVSTSSGSGFGSSVTLTQSGGTVTNTTIYAQYAPSGSGSNSGDITIASSGASSLTVAVSGSINTYYYQSGSPANTANWTALSNGTGDNPADFTTAGITYKILNNATTDAAWTVSGSGSKIVLGDAASPGATLTIAAGFGITGTIDATAASSGVNSIVVAHTALPTFGTLHSSSEVHIQASITLSTAPSFAKLFVDGTSNTLQLATGAQPKVATSLTVAAGCTLYSQGTSSIYILVQSGGTATLNGTFRTNKPAGFVTFNEGAGNATNGGALQFAVAESAGMLTLGASSTVSFTRDNSTTTQVINARTDYKNVNIDGVTNNKTINGPSTISGTLTINRTTGPSTLTLSGAVTVQTSLVLGDTVISASNLTLGNGASVSRSVGTLDAAPTFGSSVNLTYTGTTAVVVGNELPSSTTILNNLTVNNSAGVVLDDNATVNGTLTLTSGLFYVGSTALRTLTLNGPSIAGTGANLQTTSTFTNLTFGGTASSLSIPSSVASLNNLTINNANATVTMGTSLTISGTLALTNGTLSVGANTLSLNGLFTVGSGTLSTTSSSSLSFGGSLAGPTINLPSNITALNNLTINNTYSPPATINVGASVSLAGNLTITSGTLAGAANVLTVAGNLAGTGTYTSSGAGKISMTGTSKSVSALTLGNIEIASGASMSNFGPTITGTFTMTGGNVTINSGNTLVMANNSTLVRASGNLNLSGGTFAVGTSATDVMNLTIDGNLTSTSEFPGGSLNPGRIAMLTVNAGNTYTLTSSNKGVINLTLNGTIVNDASILTVRGNITGAGIQTTASGGAGKILMNGNTTTSSISAATFTNLDLNDADGFSITASPTITGTLSLTTGVLATTTNPVVVTGTVSRTSGWVNGYLRRSVASGASSVTFDVGSATAHTPLSLSFGSGTGGGQLTAYATTLASPPAAGNAPAGSGISQSKYIARSWTLGNSTIATPSFSAALTYATSPTDIIGGANPNALIAAVNNGGTWSNPGVSSSVSPTVTTVSGLTDFGDFYLGETDCINVGLTSASATASPICSNATTTLTYSGLTGTNASLTWYDGAGGTGTSYGTGTPSSSVGPGTYYAYATGNCGSPVEIQVVVGATAVNTFSGTGNWTDPTKWGCEVVPSAGDNFALAASANATLNTNLTVSGTMTLDVTSTLTINPGRELAVASGGTVNFNGASVTLKSDASGTAAIGKIIGTLSGATNVTVERYVPVYNSSFTPSHIKAWRLLAVPTYTTGSGGQTIRQAWQENGVNNNGYGTLLGISSSNFAALGYDRWTNPGTFQRYTGTAWTNVANTNSTKLDTTGAYFVFIRGNRTVESSTSVTDNSKDATLRTTGSIYQGNGIQGAGLTSSFTVAGNIYPSAIDFEQLQGNNSSKINGVYYLWDSRRKNGSSLGSYQTFSATNGYGCTPGGGSFTLNQVNTTIQSGQGFFVSPKNPGTGERLVFDESIKVSGSSNNAFRPVVPATRLVKIDTRLIDAQDGEVADGNTVVFSAHYANAIDAADAVKMQNSGENFGIKSGNALLAVEGRQPAAAGDVIAFAAGNLQEKTYVLDIAAQNLDAENLTATLEDRYAQTSTLLDLNGSTRIPVAVDGNATSKSADRFRIVFGKPTITGKAGFAVAPNPVEGSRINVRFMNQVAGRYTARILGTDGKVLQTAVLEHNGGNAVQILHMNARLSAGIYQLELTGSDRVSRVIPVLVQ